MAAGTSRGRDPSPAVADQGNHTTSLVILGAGYCWKMVAMTRTEGFVNGNEKVKIRLSLEGRVFPRAPARKNESYAASAFQELRQPGFLGSIEDDG